MMRLLLPLLVAMITLLPAQGTFCHAAEVANQTTADKTKIIKPSPSTKKMIEEKNVTAKTETQAVQETSLSTGMKIGIGAGVAAVVIGAAVAIGGGGGGGDDPAPQPPTADNLVSAWHAEGRQPGSGKSYSGTYHLYQGGSLGYDLHLSDGQHLVGGGSWTIDGYTLSIHTDHGSRYKGDFIPGNISVITLNANTGWTVTLTR